MIRRIVVMLLSATVVITVARAQQYQSPQHDLRVAIGLAVPQREIAKFYDVYYGDTIRLGEFGCGDPRFLVHVNETPRLTMAGTLYGDGTYLTNATFTTGLNAKIYGRCFGLDQPSVGGIVTLNTSLGRVSDLKEVTFNGDVSISPLASILDIRFPFSITVPLPATALNQMPIDLAPGTDQTLDFGRLVNGKWTSTDAHKTIPVTLNAGSFGGSPTDNAVLIVDGTVGQVRLKPFPNQAGARQDFENDLPLWNGKDVGVSINDTLFGSAAPSQPGSGLLGALLPIRVQGAAPLRSGSRYYSGAARTTRGSRRNRSHVFKLSRNGGHEEHPSCTVCTRTPALRSTAR
jgi:hypothetical protein